MPGNAVEEEGLLDGGPFVLADEHGAHTPVVSDGNGRAVLVETGDNVVEVFPRRRGTKRNTGVGVRELDKLAVSNLSLWISATDLKPP